MELGNMMFGNSRGEVPVPRGAGYEDELIRLFEAYAFNDSMLHYGPEFENDVFEVHPYWWGGCTCGADEQYDWPEHTADCKEVVPNFWYKPTDYQLQFYKYPLRDAYANRAVSLREFAAIIDACIESLGVNDGAD